MHCRIKWCVELKCWLTFTDWCIDVLIDELGRHVGWRLLTDALTCCLVCWIDMLVEVYWCTHVLVCVELTCWLTFTDWCIDVLVDVLNRRVGWRWLMHWHIGWCVKLTYWLAFTNALTCWLVCWIDILADFYLCTDVLVDVLNWRANSWTVLLDAIVVVSCIWL